LSDFEKLQKDYKQLQAKSDDGGQAARKAEAAQEAAENQLADIRQELAEKERKLKEARERLDEAEKAEKAAKAEAQAGKAALGKRESELYAIRHERNELQLGQQILAKEATQLREQVVSIRPVRYQLASADVVAQQQRVLAEVQEVLAVYPEAEFAITGHTCNLGAKELNLMLSQERAEGLQNFLLQNGVAEDRLALVKGLADEQPEASNETDAGRQRNRRVEIEVLR
jgi:outer membrane protein OmpA-like peptidoglycan-associated protein